MSNPIPILNLIRFIYVRDSHELENKKQFFQHLKLSHFNQDVKLNQFYYASNFIPLSPELYVSRQRVGFILAPDFASFLNNNYIHYFYFSITALRVIGFDFLSPFQFPIFSEIINDFEATKLNRVCSDKAELTEDFLKELIPILTKEDQNMQGPSTISS